MNLLLNIPLPGHGKPDDDEMSFLEKFGEGMALNSEAIYSTRLWKIAGEGPTKPGGSLYSGRGPRFTAEDIRFTTKADTLYAIAMGWPQDRKLVVPSLATGSAHYPRRNRPRRVGGFGIEPGLVARRRRTYHQLTRKGAMRLGVRFQDQPSRSLRRRDARAWSSPNRSSLQCERRLAPGAASEGGCVVAQLIAVGEAAPVW